MKETFYFSHDYNARTDDKIKRLIRKHGMAGYGIFWAIIEDLYNNANALQLDCDGIAFELRTDSETIKSILHDFDLFVFDGDMFGSLSVQKRLDERNNRSETARENARKRWGKMQSHSNSNATALPPQSKGNAIKERKGKEKKENNSFDRFWDLYGKKVDRAACERKWAKIDHELHELIFAHVAEYVKSTPDIQYRRNPETYLNNRSWENEITKQTKDETTGSDVGRYNPTDEWERRWIIYGKRTNADGKVEELSIAGNDELLEKVKSQGWELTRVTEVERPANLKGWVM